MRLVLQVLGACAGLFGACGVGLAAIGAHVSGNPNVTTAAYFLLFHAGGLAALVAVAVRLPSRVTIMAGALIAIGTTLFSGDLALRALAHITLVPLAAPTGGVIMIIGWVIAAFALPLSIRPTREDGLPRI